MPTKNASVDIFGLLSDDSTSAEAEKKKRRKELLESTGVKELFKDGKISINNFTCVGGQCKLCIKACPTNALYWSNGKVGIIEDLCVYCGACVLSCMVEDCVKVERKRDDDKVEQFSKTKDILMLNEKLNAKKRLERAKSILPTVESYCEKSVDKTADLRS